MSLNPTPLGGGNLVDIPSASQIFGHIVYSSNIQGILYQSKYRQDQCLAIFPKNFSEEPGHIELSDSPSKGIITRLDRETWQDLL